MRKISKSRVEDADDVVSSTNGSVLNDDDQHDEDKDKESEKSRNSGDSDNEKDDEPLNSSKSRKSKGRARPKSTPKKSKSKKEKDAGSDEDEPEEQNGNSGDSDNENDEPLNSSKSRKIKGRGGRPKSTPKKSKSKKAEKDAGSDEDEPEEEYEVEKIIDSKKIKGRVHYLIRWKGYSASSDSWEPENTLSCDDLIEKFKEEHQNNSTSKESSSKAGKGKKRKGGKKESKSSPAKKPKNVWDSENADENEEYEVERILEVHHKKNGKREFLIHWKGWSTKFDSWEPEEHLNCEELIEKFMSKVSAAKSSDSRSLRVAPETTHRFTLQAPSSGRRLSKRRGQKQRVRYDDAE